MYKRAILIGGGASIPDDFNWDILKNEFTIGINYIIKIITPTVLIFDNKELYKKLKVILSETEAILISPNYKDEKVIKLPASQINYGKRSLEMRKIYCGTLTGIYALTIARCLPFEEIYLMGYDLNRTDGMVHYKKLKHPMESMAPYHQSHRFRVFKNVKNIFNVSPNSAINVFPKLDYQSFYRILDKDKQMINQKEARKWLIKQIQR